MIIHVRKEGAREGVEKDWRSNGGSMVKALG